MGWDHIRRSELSFTGTTLTIWLMLSRKAPVIYDSVGMLSVLDRFRRPTQARWVPALDTMTLARRVGKEESYWPVGLSSKEFMCIILKVCCSSRRRLLLGLIDSKGT